MKPFRAFYYANDACSPVTLAKSILAFDEITFYDHTSILIGKVGTVGHHSHMRGYIEPFAKEGYKIEVLEPIGGPIEDDLKTLIDADISNQAFREVFYKLMHNDPYFLMTKVHDGNYGKYGDGEAYRKRILELKLEEIPSSVDEIAQWSPTEDSIPPEINIASTMALDAFHLNFAGYASLDRDYQLFGDSVGMDMLLKAKFAGGNKFEDVDKGISQNLAYALIDHVVPVAAFKGKKFTDIIHFRNDTANERQRFKERIMEMTVELKDLSGANKVQKIDELIYKSLLPEVRTFQNSLAKNRDTVFKDSVKSVVLDADTIAKEVATILPLSVSVALLAATAHIGKAIVPNLVDYLATKKDIERRNPYSYLMKFH
jgi:hypothetical protein